jgi:hypothetical protein
VKKLIAPGVGYFWPRSWLLVVEEFHDIFRVHLRLAYDFPILEACIGRAFQVPL